MGTNYYVKSNICEHCGKGDEDLHIGKSSAGWVFSLHVMPELEINDLDDWERFWKDKKIVDEYGSEFSCDDMRAIITERGRKADWNKRPYGYGSWEEFHQKNHSKRGPSGLLRHQIDGHCIGHGEGTWDLIVGEFS